MVYEMCFIVVGVFILGCVISHVVLQVTPVHPVFFEGQCFRNSIVCNQNYLVIIKVFYFNSIGLFSIYKACDDC